MAAPLGAGVTLKAEHGFSCDHPRQWQQHLVRQVRVAEQLVPTAEPHVVSRMSQSVLYMGWAVWGERPAIAGWAAEGVLYGWVQLITHGPDIAG